MKKIILAFTMFLVLIMNACSLDQQIESKINAKENPTYHLDYTYVNENKYTDGGKKLREVEYIGGTNITIEREYPLSDNEFIYVGDRWYPFFRDKNTGEILRGLETYDYITVGMPFIGLDRISTPKERMTRKGFQSYVLKWTACLKTRKHEKYEPVGNKKNLREYYNGQYIYSNKKYNGYFDLPIDVIADNMWGKHYESDDRDIICIEKIYNIDDVKDKKYNLNEYRLSSNGWVLNILRNCFGYISDVFYDIYCRDKISFDKINLEDVCIGDIGVMQENENKSGTDYYMGICIGFDKALNPIFSVALPYKMTKDIVGKYLRNGEITFGSNMLHIENIKNVDNNIFNFYCRTDLPFTDDNKNKKNYIIDDIEKYNKQIEYCLNKEEYIKNNVDLNKILLDERIERINNREKVAEKKRLEHNIDLSKYIDMDISTIYMINQTKTYEYEKYYSDLKNMVFTKKPDDYIKKTDKERIIENRKETTFERNKWFNSLNDNEKEEYYRNSNIEEMIENYKNVVDWNDIEAVNKWLNDNEAPDEIRFCVNKYLIENSK